MAFEQITNLKSYKKINTDLPVQKTQAKIAVENFKKILSASSTAFATRYEYDTDKVNVVAEEKIAIIYIDNENNIKTIEKNNEFSFIFQTQDTNQFFIELKEQETTIEQLGSGELVATSVFLPQLYSLQITNFSAVKPNNENVFEKTKSIEVQTLCATCQDKFAVSYECEITASSVLSSEAKCYVSSVTATDDSIVVDGELFVNLLTEIDGNIKQTNKKIDFSGEVVALGLKKEDIVDAKVQVENLVVGLSNAGANATISINATIGVYAECYSESSVEVVEDAFMEKQELIVSSVGIKNNKILKSKSEIQENECILQCKDKNLNMGTILATINPKYENGVLSCTVLYREAETDEISSIIMYSDVEKIERYKKIAITSFSKKRANEVLIEYVTMFNYCDENSTFDVFATNIELGAEIEPDNKGIIVYSAKKGQTLFDIAKSLKTNPNVIKEQNDNLEESLTCDRKILIYKSAIV